MKYEAKFSALGKAGGWAFLAIILCWLIVPLILWIFYCISIHFHQVEIYPDKVILKKGVLAKSQKQMTLTGILSVSVSKTLIGTIFHYGTVSINTVGRHCDLTLEGIKNPEALKAFLEQLFVNKEEVKQFITE